MKLEFYQNGRQFFFITLVVEGRKKILSQIVEGGRGSGASPRTPEDVARQGPEDAARQVAEGAAARRAVEAGVEPTALGRQVIALWLKLHALCPALTASNFIIMPDHVHLLLMVDFSRLRGGFNPLVFIHWFRDWSSRQGDVTPVVPPNWVAYYRPGEAARAFGWEDGFWLDLAIGSRHLKAIRRYMKLNPARALWKQRHPDRFKVTKVATARLLAVAPQASVGGSGDAPDPRPVLPATLTALGNLALLGSPFLLHVRLTLKKTVAEHEAAIAEIVERAKRGAIPVSGFISPGEKEVLRRLKAEAHVRFVKIVPFALPARYDPSAEDSRELAGDRLAIVSLQPETAAIRSIDIRRSQSAARQFRQNCLAMNDLAAALCAKNT